MHERERWDLLTHATLSRRLAAGCRDSRSAEALLALAEEYERRARALERRDAA
ncbi:hypothetical protein [Sphingomonas parva]|uniref:hypothetical protein n=1 Tax=Sphingomonas parva TaxID=2555898 RepID=UPI001430F31C|nr:hypothetical protein [Sphingomonas parva]